MGRGVLRLWSGNGSRANGPRSRDRSRPASGRSSSACSASAQAYRLPPDLPDAGRQGRACAIHPRPHGAARAVRAAERRWLPALRSELLSFPAGKHDDHVDALGLIGQLLDTITAGSNRPPPDRR